MTPTDAARLQERVRRLEESLVALDPASMGPVAAGTATSLDEPVRIAVVGRVKAGKSTLVNALIGRRIAPTDEAECTRIVTWYRYGGPERALLHLRDGSVVTLESSPQRMLPDELPVPLDLISHAEVFVQEAALRDRILVDTPGLGSTSDDRSSATRRAVLQSERVDALLYVVRDTVLGDDEAFLDEVAAATGIGDVIGVLSHSDVFGGSPWSSNDPVDQAAVFAQRHARGRLSAMVPFAGLLAEAVATGRIDNADVAVLAALDAVGDEDLQDGEGLPDGVEWPTVEELAARVGWYGIARGRAPAVVGAAALIDWATRTGGGGALERQLRTRFVGRHRQLRAVQVLHAFEVAADGSPQRARLHEAIAEARLAMELHPLRELRAAEALRSVDPDAAVLRDLDRVIDADDDRAALDLLESADAAAIRSAAADGAAMARTVSLFAPTTAEELAARALERSYDRIAARW